MNWIILAIFIIGYGLSFINKDVFSPAKFYFLFFLTGFNQSFLNDNLELYIFNYELIFLTIGYILIFSEIYLLRKINSSVINAKYYVINNENVFLCKKVILGLIVCVSILYLIAVLYSFGTINGYVNSINTRVQSWKGLGYLILMPNIIYILGFIYFILELNDFKKNIKINKTAIISIFLLCLIIAFVSASRGNYFRLCLMIIMLFHYQYCSISIKKYLSLIAIGMILLNITVVIRDHTTELLLGTLPLATLVSQVSTHYNQASYLQGTYGINPLEIIYNHKYIEFKLGTTYLAAFTNFIPRKIYPKKFASGGTILTSIVQSGPLYTASSPGVIAEGIINFGYLWGPIFGLMVLLMTNGILLYSYIRFKLNYKQANLLKLIDHTVCYFYIVMFLPMLPYSEFATTYNTLMMYLCVYGIFRFFLKRLLEKRKLNMFSTALSSD